jgi:hypothetical protein
MGHTKNSQDRRAALDDKQLPGRPGLSRRLFVLEPAHAGMHTQVFSVP